MDSGEESIWMKKFNIDEPPVPVVLYSDNYVIIGNEEYAISSHMELKKAVTFSDEPSWHLSDVLGMQKDYIRKGSGVKIMWHQSKYADHVVEWYEKEFMQGKKLKKWFFIIYI